MRHNDTNNMIPSPTPCYMHHFHIFDKIHSFLKNISNPMAAKKENYISEEQLNLKIIVD